MYYKSQTNDPTVCGIYIIAKPEQTVHVYFDYVDVPCNTGGLIAVSANVPRAHTFVSPGARSVPVRARACTKVARNVFGVPPVRRSGRGLKSKPNQKPTPKSDLIACCAGGGTHSVVVVRKIRSDNVRSKTVCFQRAGFFRNRR